MKLPRLLLKIVGALLILLALAAGLGRLPAVQRWAVLQAAGSKPELALQVARISAGPTGAEIDGLQFTRQGMTVKVDRLEADYSLFALLFRSRLVLDRLQVRGLEIDASHLSRKRAEAGAAAVPAAAPGALGRLNLPVEIEIGRVSLQGRALLPGATGRPAVLSEYQLTGGGISPGKEGALHLQAKLGDPSVSARVGALQASIDLRLRQSLQRTFESVGLNALVDAEGPGLTGHDQLKLGAELNRAEGGEKYRLRLDTVLGGQAANLLSIDATLPTAGGVYQGVWSLTAKTAQIEPFFLGGALPIFDLRGRGGFTFNQTARDGSLTGDLEGEIDELGAVRPTLRALGAVKFRSRIDLAVNRQAARLNHWELSLAGAFPVIELQANNAATYNFSQHQFTLGDAGVGEVLHLRLLGVPLAWMRPFISPVDVSGGFLTGEVVIGRNADQRLVADTVAPLVVQNLTVVQAGRVLLNQGELQAEADAEFTGSGTKLRIRQLRLRTAAGDDLALKGELGAMAGAETAYSLQLDYSADLPQLLSPWLPAGHLRAQGSSDLTLQGTQLGVKRHETILRGEKGEAMLSLKLCRPIVYDLAKSSLVGGEPEAEIATLNTGIWPMVLLGRILPGFAASGAAQSGEFVLSGAGDHFSLQSRAPVRLSNFSLSCNRRPLIDRVIVEMSPAAELTAGRLTRLTGGNLVLRGDTGTELGQLTPEMALTADGIQHGTLGFNFNLAEIASQPALANLAALSAGRASGEIRTVSGAGALRVEARVTLNGLVLREASHSLPVANFSLRADATADGHLSLQAPILLDRSGVRTDLNLVIEGTRTHPGLKIDATLSGEHADLTDALQLLGAAGAPGTMAMPESKATQGRALSPPAADSLPFWHGLTGQLQLDLKSVTRGQEWSMTGLTGRLEIDPARIRLKKIEANFGEKSRLSMKGEISFSDTPNPYSLAGDISLTEFDAGKLFKALDPGRPPTVEGLFTFTGHAEGQGLTLDDTIDRLRGQVQLTSRQGVFRGFKRASEKISVASKAVEWSAALGSILGTDRVKQTAEKMAGHSYQVDQLGQMLAELNYDQLSLRLVREPSLNVQLQDISLVSPEIRLLGNGTVTYTAGQPLLAQPLSVTLTLAARGKFEQLLGKLKELDGGRDELGYAKTKNAIALSGTLAKPDPRPYFNRLASSKLTDFLGQDN